VTSRPSSVADVAGEVVNELVRKDRRVVIDEPQPLRDLLAKSIAHRRRTLRLLMLAAGVVLLLTAFSVSGALGRFVEHRTREIALRKALGSGPRRTGVLVVRSIAGACSLGVVAGCLGRWLLAHRLRTNCSASTPAIP
jgi:predicted lysophospholipase L1 biosynthesis ABC-type transport system permease subunit